MPAEIGGNPRVRPHEKVDADDYTDLSDYDKDTDTRGSTDGRKRGDAGRVGTREGPPTEEQLMLWFLDYQRKVCETMGILTLRTLIGNDGMRDLADDMESNVLLDIADDHTHQMAGVWNSQFDYYPEAMR